MILESTTHVRDLFEDLMIILCVVDAIDFSRMTLNSFCGIRKARNMVASRSQNPWAHRYWRLAVLEDRDRDRALWLRPVLGIRDSGSSRDPGSSRDSGSGIEPGFGIEAGSGSGIEVGIRDPGFGIRDREAGIRDREGWIEDS